MSALALPAHQPAARPKTAAAVFAVPSRSVLPGSILQRQCACGGVPGPDGECAACRARRLARQRRGAGEIGETGAGVPAVVGEVLRAPGQPLGSGTRAFMESRLGHDFSWVRVHSDARAAAAAQAVDAFAFTVGSQIFFGAGQYAPGTAAGRRLLAHELTHVTQQPASIAGARLTLDGPTPDRHEVEAQLAAERIDAPAPAPVSAGAPPGRVRRAVRRENVSCRDAGLTGPDLTGDEAVAAIDAADVGAIELARRAELLLDFHLLFVEIGEAADPAFDTILREELGLTLTNPAHHGLIRQQRDRFRRVRETLESGFLRYLCRGGTVSLVGCLPGGCAGNHAFSCPGNQLVVLCQTFWDTPDERDATLMHEPFHVLFSMLRHAPNALRRADANCFEAFAMRIAGRATDRSCAGHTAG